MCNIIYDELAISDIYIYTISHTCHREEWDREHTTERNQHRRYSDKIPRVFHAPLLLALGQIPYRMFRNGD